MPPAVQWSARERIALVTIAALGGLGLNGVFLYVMFVRRDLLDLALRDPLAWALMAEALLVTGLLAWLFARRGVGALRPWAFWLLSLAGGVAFGICVSLLRERHPDGHER